MNKKYDVILYGASGFTGRQTVEYFLNHAPSSLKWAIAGRNASKLQKLKESLVLNANLGFKDRANSIDCIEAESGDKQAIQNMVSSTRVILTTAGPFSLYGKSVLASCAELGVDYVDITGETAFIRDMMDSHQEIALKTGAKLIPFSGFDSVPSDLGVFCLSKAFQEKFQEPLQSAKGVFSVKGGFNGGTLLSMIHMLESGDWKRMLDPGLLMPKGQYSIQMNPDTYEASFEPKLQKWIAPFVMAVINTRVVNRSASLFTDFGTPYGSNFFYSEHHGLGSFWNPLPAYTLSSGMKAFQTMGQFALFRELLRKLGPGASEGPSQEARDNGSYSLQVLGIGERVSQAILEFSGQGDPGNKATVLFVCESALALALDRERLPGGNSRAGFLTPSTGLGDVLVDRLRKRGVKIELTSQS